VSEPLLICEVCEQNQAIGVCCVPGVPYSAAYCRECATANNHPMHILIANTASLGGLQEAVDWWQEMVTSSLRNQGKTLEWFNEQVYNLIRNRKEDGK
jgi:hypothetical protein